MGGTGWGWSGSLVRHQENCGVFTAGSCTIEIHTRLLLCRSSVRTLSVKPRIANFAPQYADCSGMARYASAEPTCTTLPWSRGTIRRSADMRAVHRAEVGHLGGTAELLRLDVD